MSYIYQRLIKENNTNNPELHKKATHRLRCHATRSKKAMFQRRCTHIVKIQKHKISNRSRVMTTSGREKCCKEGPAGGSVEGEVSARMGGGGCRESPIPPASLYTANHPCHKRRVLAEHGALGAAVPASLYPFVSKNIHLVLFE